ncbi:MAG: hypothetical protein L5656_09510 [Thermanaeromonas sp.]|nr:hypothetical protein [Thermanaeromonas sp.]MCG0278749.1 hypothetical protein [Thermanaeromonas sp.]
MPRALQLHPRDNVAVVLSNVQAGEEVRVATEEGEIRLIAGERIFPLGIR